MWKRKKCLPYATTTGIKNKAKIFPHWRVFAIIVIEFIEVKKQIFNEEIK